MSRRDFLKGLAGALVALSQDFPARSLAAGLAPGVPNGADPVRGIYVPGWRAVTRQRAGSLVEFLGRHGLNTLMVDVKNAHGELFYAPRHPLARKMKVQASTRDGDLRSLRAEFLVEEAKARGIRLVARHVMFRDRALYDTREDLRMKGPGNQHWVDLRKEEVAKYNLALIAEEIALGFDEIVLDYIRFPATAGFGDEEGKNARIGQIVSEVSRISRHAGVDLGVQVFGYAAWHYRKAGVGQDIVLLAPSVEVIYPMLYPSHFWPGSFGFSDPSRHPYEFIAMGYREAAKKVDSGTRIIPMIQAFWYEAAQVREQIRAVTDLGMPGFMCWNPAGRYAPDYFRLRKKDAEPGRPAV